MEEYSEKATDFSVNKKKRRVPRADFQNMYIPSWYLLLVFPSVLKLDFSSYLFEWVYEFLDRVIFPVVVKRICNLH